MAKAEKAARAKDDEAVLEALNNAFRLWHKSDGKKAKMGVLLLKAAIYEKRSDWDAALKETSAALALEPKNAGIIHKRGKIHLQRSDLPKAMDDFYKAISLNSGLKEAYFDRGRTYELQGDVKFAAEDYRAACRLGHKPACRMKKQPSPKASPVDDAQEEPSEEPEKVAPSPSKPADFAACISYLSRCTDEGGTFESCVAAAPSCDKNAVAPCCPVICQKRYRNALNDGISQAEAFRQFFSPDSPCAKQ